MAKQLQLRRGTTQANALFTGAQGEITMDTEKNLLRVHDGTTPGGFMIDTVVAFQAPTASNNYTWYRKYASGWVEQGGTESVSSTTYKSITLPITMSTTDYIINTTTFSGQTTEIRSGHVLTTSKSTTGFQFGWPAGSSAVNFDFTWEVKGLAA